MMTDNTKNSSVEVPGEKSNNFPYEIVELDKELNNKINSSFGVARNYVLAGPKKYCFPNRYKELARDFYNFQTKSDDVWVFGFLRSGTTIMKELLWLIGNNLDYQKAVECGIDWRVPFFERHMFYMENSSKIPTINKELTEYCELTETYPDWNYLIQTKEKRFIKTHLPISLINPEVLTKGCKLVYMARNPKDVIVSNYLLQSSFLVVGFKGSLEDFWHFFRNNLVSWSPYFEHVKEGWANRHNDNVLFLFYEELTKDMRKTFVKVADFLGKSLTNEQLDKLEEHFKIDNFRKNKSVNNDHMRNLGLMKDEDDTFIRRGKIGGWRDYFTEKMNAEVDKWIEENLKGSDLKFLE